MTISEKVKRHVDMIKRDNLTRQEFIEIVSILEKHFGVSIYLKPDDNDDPVIWKHAAKMKFLSDYCDEDSLYDNL